MNNKKSTTLIGLGVAVFVAGAALLFLVIRHNDNHKSSAKSPPASTGVVRTEATQSTPTTIATTLSVPAGENAFTIPMNYFEGGGGYVHTGDKLNIFAVVNKNCTTNPTAAVKLIMSNVPVLQVIESAPAVTGGPSAYVLGVTPQQAELLIFHHEFNQLYFTLTAPNAASASTTGITCANQL